MRITKEHLLNFERAIHFYEQKGYENIKVPWFVSEEAIDVTRPQGAELFTSPAGCLVASAEQSFIQMMLDGKLYPGKYQTLTPCFRDDERDEWHTNAFLKLELIHFAAPNKYHLNEFNIMNDAKECFEMLGMKTEYKLDCDGPGKHDLVCGGIEIGSYGTRKYKDFYWSYGTGLAEARFTKVLNRSK